jgi:hypothetical protein
MRLAHTDRKSTLLADGLDQEADGVAGAAADHHHRASVMIMVNRRLALQLHSSDQMRFPSGGLMSPSPK